MIWRRTQNSDKQTPAAGLEASVRKGPSVVFVCCLEGGDRRNSRSSRNSKCFSLAFLGCPVTILISLFLVACGSKKPKQTTTAPQANNPIPATYTVAHNPDPA